VIAKHDHCQVLFMNTFNLLVGVIGLSSYQFVESVTTFCSSRRIIQSGRHGTLVSTVLVNERLAVLCCAMCVVVPVGQSMKPTLSIID